MVQYTDKAKRRVVQVAVPNMSDKGPINGPGYKLVVLGWVLQHEVVELGFEVSGKQRG